MAEESTVENTPTTESAAPAKKAAKRAPAKKASAASSAASDAPAAKKAPARRAAKKTAPTAEAPLEAPAADVAAETLTESAAPAKKAAAKRAPAKRTTAKKVAAAEAPEQTPADVPAEVAETAPAKKAATKRAPAKRTAAKKTVTETPEQAPAEASDEAAPEAAPAKKTTKRAPAKRTAAKKAAAPAPEAAEPAAVEAADAEQTTEAASSAPGVLFQAPKKTTRTRAPRKAKVEPVVEEPAEDAEDEELAEAPADADADADAIESDESAEGADEDNDDDSDDSDESGTPARRRRRRGGRRRRKPAGEGNGDAEGDESNDSDAEGESDASAESNDEQSDDSDEQGEGGTSRRRRRRRRAGEAGTDNDDEPNTVVKVRESRPLEQQITAVSGSTRLEAKKQRRREGREAGRRRAPIVSEAEFLARRESVERVMVIRQRDDLTQIGVLEDKVLVEHYVARESQTSLIGNVYLGRVQNVLPSMEAAFVDIGKGRNAVLYAGEVNWASLGWKEGQPRKIESVLSSGQTILVQVTKDPVGHKGARLTSQVSLAGRFLVYVPDGTTSGISRKLPDTERNRLKALLKEIVPDTAGVIVRTAAEGASEEELTRDVERLKARWEDIEAKTSGKGSGNPQLLYGEPDLTLKVVRDLFTEDFAKLVIQGDEAWETVKGYVEHVAPDLGERLQRFVPGQDGRDAFQTYRIEEQISKGLDRKVWLPSGGSLIIDRTEAMTVVDVNTGKFTGSGGNLEETVTKNNLEAAEEIVRQLRLRDIGGIIVVDFIDMVLESNRDLVLRRLVECLGRDRTRHQVAEVTSLGLVQMTRKRIGTGLLEAFSETCTHCQGRGVITHEHPVEEGKSSGVLPDEPRRSRRRGGKGRGNGGDGGDEQSTQSSEQAEHSQPSGHAEEHHHPTPAEFAAMARHEEEAAAQAAADKAAEADEAAAAIDASDVVEAAEPAEAVVVEDFEEAPVAAPEAPEEPEQPAEPAAPSTPTVVTRTRGRRGASRPAGVTPVVTEPVPVAIVVEPAAAAPAEISTPEPPKVITRTRGGASRAVTTAEPDAAASADEHPMEHVPVKKKGARKR